MLAGRRKRADAVVVSQVLGVWAKVAEAEVRLRHFEEIDLPQFKEVVSRVEELEDRLAETKGAGWGA